jgi:hypothetical protein
LNLDPILSPVSPPSPPLLCRPWQTPTSMSPVIPALHIPPNQSPSLPPDKPCCSCAHPASHTSLCMPRARPALARHAQRDAGCRIRTNQSVSLPPGKPAAPSARQSLALAIPLAHTTIFLANQPASTQRPLGRASLLPAS